MAEEGYDLSVTNRQLEILQRKGKIMSSNNFYVYCKEFYSVWEPAEGGYYVECSTVTQCEEHIYLTDAVYSLLECLVDAAEHGHTIDRGTWKIDWCADIWEDEDGIMRPDISLLLPWFRLDQNGYIGEGFEVGICMNKPEDKPYLGYC